MRQVLNKLRRKHGAEKKLLNNLAREVSKLKQLNGKLLIRNLVSGGMLDRISDAEFSVNSQFGEDGIIQYLIRQVPGIPNSFIEFGVEDYTEANTRFLLENDNWRGLILDCDTAAMKAIRKDELFWRHDLTAVGAFVNCENINKLFAGHGFVDEVGILSIDIDGNDYWVWESISIVRPSVVIVEYNSTFGPDHKVTIPYDPCFSRREAHSSMLYWGCSLSALCDLAERKGYSLVGCESSGINAFFVRSDRLGSLRPLSASEAFVQSKIRQSRDERNNLTFLDFEQSQVAIKNLPLVDVRSGSMTCLANLMEANG